MLNAKIVWIASYPKSGNTWARIIIDRLLSKGEPLDLNVLPPSFKSAVGDYIVSKGIDPSKISREQVVHKWPEIQEFVQERATRNRVFLKTHNLSARFDGTPFPNPLLTERAVYVVRDPRDVALSSTHHFKCSLEQAVAYLCDPEKRLAEPGKHYLLEVIGSWGLHVKSWTQGKRFPVLVLRYEDMLARPDNAVANIAGFLGLAPSTDEIARIVADSSFSAVKGLELRDGFRESVREGGFFRKGQAGQWRGAPDQSTFNPLIEAFGPLMQRYGYLE